MKLILFSLTLFCLVENIEAAISCEGIPLQECRQLDLHEGRLQVPLDWFDRGDTRQVEVRYRIIGYQRTDKPYLFFIGGGPGMPTIDSYYYPKDFASAGGLLEHYRVVIFDQRGVGTSTPLNSESADLKPETIARYFSARQIVRDLGFMIHQFGAKEREFDILGHSAGGFIAAQYLANREVGPRPRAVIFAHTDAVSTPAEFLTSRFVAQIELNRKIMTPSMKRKVMRIRKRLASLNQTAEVLPTGAVDALVDFLDNPKRLNKWLSELSSSELSDAEFIEKLRKLRFLNYASDKMLEALSAVYQDGYTDLEMAQFNNSLAKDEKDWMLLDRRLFESVLSSEFARNRLGPNGELELRLAGRRYSHEMVRGKELGALSEDVAVFAVLGSDDTYVDYRLAARGFDEAFRSPRHMRDVILDGTHYSIFSPEYAQTIVDRIAELSAPNRVGTCDAWLFPTSATHGKN